ncbi:hypothetical protein L7F22_002555 [Adiantum nelumboides]|nr:hypothetical protein [Adiantum nelumboides]
MGNLELKWAPADLMLADQQERFPAYFKNQEDLCAMTNQAYQKVTEMEWESKIGRGAVRVNKKWSSKAKKSSSGLFQEFGNFINVVASTKVELTRRHSRVSQCKIRLKMGPRLIRLHGSKAAIEPELNAEFIAEWYNNWLNLMKDGLSGGKRKRDISALLGGSEEERADHELGKVEAKILFQGGGESTSRIDQETMTTFKFRTLALSVLV